MDKEAVPSLESKLGLSNVRIKICKSRRVTYIEEHITNYTVILGEIREAFPLGAIYHCIEQKYDVGKWLLS